MADKKGYSAVEGLGPTGENCTFWVSISLLKHLQRYGPHQKFYDALLLPEALLKRLRIFQGLNRDGYDGGYGYVSLPSKRYRSHDVELPPPPGLLFIVFVRQDFVVMDWEWRKIHEGNSTYPKDWENDFDKEIWP